MLVFENLSPLEAGVIHHRSSQDKFSSPGRVSTSTTFGYFPEHWPAAYGKFASAVNSFAWLYVPLGK